MQVPSPDAQHGVMIEAVENHMPEVVVIDEIGTTAEALAARTIAERGVQLIATAHGNTLDNLLRNPTLADLVGGIHAVTLSDEEARRRGPSNVCGRRAGKWRSRSRRRWRSRKVAGLALLPWPIRGGGCCASFPSPSAAARSGG